MPQKWVVKNRKTHSCSPHFSPYSGFVFERILGNVRGFLKTERSSQNWNVFSTDYQKLPLVYGSELLRTNPSRLFIFHSQVPITIGTMSIQDRLGGSIPNSWNLSTLWMWLNCPSPIPRLHLFDGCHCTSCTVLPSFIIWTVLIPPASSPAQFLLQLWNCTLTLFPSSNILLSPHLANPHLSFSSQVRC